MVLNVPTNFVIAGIIIIALAFLYPIVFKKRIAEKLQREVQKSYFKTKDALGNEYTEEVLFKKSKLPLVGDWGRIYPPINEDGSTNWMNLIFGGKRNFFRLLVILVILGLTFYWVFSVLGAGAEYLNGEKYVIVEKSLFNTFCQQVIPESNMVNSENITIYLPKVAS